MRPSPSRRAWPRGPARSQPVARGFVIVDGRYLPPPYTVTREDGQLRVNGVAVGGEQPAPPGGAWGVALRPGSGGGRWRVGYYARALRRDSLLLGRGAEAVRIVPRRRAVELLAVLLSDSPDAQKAKRLADALPDAMGSRAWGEVAASFQPEPDLAGRVAALKKELEELTAAEPPQSDAAIAKARAIGFASMALAAVALGLLFTHRPRGWRGVDPSGAGSRLAVGCVALLALLNLTDLAFTLLARGAGGFLELNPLIAPYIRSGAAVVAFKLALLAPCVIILLALRRRRLAQYAAWWVCLFYTMVLARWALYHSLFLA